MLMLILFLFLLGFNMLELIGERFMGQHVGYKHRWRGWTSICLFLLHCVAYIFLFASILAGNVVW